MATKQPKRKRTDGRQGPGSRKPGDKNKTRKPAVAPDSSQPKIAPDLAEWMSVCLDNQDTVVADIFRTIPADPAARFAYMERMLMAKGIWVDLACSSGLLDMETAIKVQREQFLAAAQLTRLSRDALGTSEFDSVMGHMAEPGKHRVQIDADGKVQLRLVTLEETKD